MACKYKKELGENGFCQIACYYCTYDIEAECKYNKQNNYDRIKNMTVEEMAEFLMDWLMRCIMGNAPLNVKEWLLSETE